MKPNYSKVFPIIALLTINLKLALSKSKGKFTIVVVEYEAIHLDGLDPQERINKNGLNYVRITKSVLGHKPDIIVFPEGTLDEGRQHNAADYSFSFGPGANPCNQRVGYLPFLQDLSCIAKNNSLTVVLNLIQKIGDNYESRDIEIDTSGTINSRMSKLNRLGETGLSETAYGSEKYKFCQDLDRQPLGIASFEHVFRIVEDHDLTWIHGIKHFVVSSKWISELPFLTSLQVQQMWAYEEDVNLYVSGANYPEYGIGGTGIFHGRLEPIVMDILPRGGSKVYVYKHDDSSPATHPGNLLTPPTPEEIDVLAKDLDNFETRTDENFEKYTTKVIDPDKDITDETLCHSIKGVPNPFCCKFKIYALKTKHLDHMDMKRAYTYRMVAFSGVRNYFDTYKRNAEICGVVACLDSQPMSCGLRFSNYAKVEWAVKFNKIIIEADFIDDKYRRQYPNSLLSSLRPVAPSHTSWTKKQVMDVKNPEYLAGKTVTLVRRKFTLRKPQDRLLTFAIYGRNLKEIEPEGGNVADNPETLRDRGNEEILHRLEHHRRENQVSTPSNGGLKINGLFMLMTAIIFVVLN